MNGVPTAVTGRATGLSRKEEDNRHVRDSKSLDRALVRGLAWTGVVKWSSQLLAWLSTIVVARLLRPEDYGLVAMAGVFLGFIALFNEFGLGTAVVTLRHLTKEQLAKTHSLACLLGTGGFLAACLVSMPAGNFFRSMEVTLIIVTSGIGFIFASIRSVPSSLCEKELRFKFLAFLEGGEAILTSLITVLLAWEGAGYWALVLGGLAGNAVAGIVLLMFRPLRFSWPSWSAVNEVLRLSTHIFVGRLAWYIASKADVFIGGRVLGHGMVGAYSFAATIAHVPVEKVSGLASRVMPALYSSVQTDPAAIRRYLLLLTESISLITFPMGIGMALVAQDFIALFFGEKWQAAVVPLQILAGWASFRSLIALIAPILNATGNARVLMMNGFLCVILYPMGFWIGSQFGAVGLALAWVGVQPPSLIIPCWRMLQVTGTRMRDCFSALWPATSAVIVMGGCLLGLQYLLPETLSLLYRFMIEIALGGFSYVITVFAFHRERIMNLQKIIRSSRG